MSSDLSNTETNSSDESKGRTYGLDGDLFVVAVVTLFVAITSFTLLFTIFAWGWLPAFIVVGLPSGLVYGWVFGLTEAKAAKLLVPDYMGRIGFPDYAFQNNGANLRRMRARLGVLERDKAAPETTQDGNNGVRLEDSPSDNRVRLFFPGKPDSAIRTRLKSNGFRWTPSLGCWQAYRNSRSMEQAAQFVAEPKESSAA